MQHRPTTVDCQSRTRDSAVPSSLLAGLNLGNIGVETDRRGFVPVTDKMEVVGKDGKVVPNVYCIGDANGKYMLAHAASAQVRNSNTLVVCSSSDFDKLLPCTALLCAAHAPIVG